MFIGFPLIFFFKKLKNFYADIGFSLFLKGNFAEAFPMVMRISLDVRELIYYFPELYPKDKSSLPAHKQLKSLNLSMCSLEKNSCMKFSRVKEIEQ